jgi:hypothetical protein
MTMKGKGKVDALYVKGCAFVCRNVTSSVEKRDALLLVLRKIHAGGTYALALLFGLVGVGVPFSETGSPDHSVIVYSLLAAGVFVLYVRTKEKWATS